MSTGTAVGIGAAVVGAGAVGYFVLRRKPTAGASPPTVTLPPSSAPPKPPSPIVSAYQALQSISADKPITSSIDALQKINDAACDAVVGSKGVPTGLASVGCDVYGKYLSPIGLAKTTIGLVEAIPVIGGPVKTAAAWAGTAVDTVAKLPMSMAAPIGMAARATASTVARVAAVPVHIVAAGVKDVTGAVVGIAKSPVKSIATIATAPLVLASKTVTIPAHYAAAAASTVAKGAVSLVKSLNPFSW
jgi:hypothetical protein